MNTKHTPNKWKANAILNGRIVGGADAPSFDKIHINGTNTTIAVVFRSSDARLIAAAPELLSTLKGVAAYCPVFVHDDILALIAKAEGSGQAESDANARLIAKAPEMCELLRECVKPFRAAVVHDTIRALLAEIDGTDDNR